MPEGTDKLVLEMGQDHLGDIHLLSELAHPKAAIVTLIGEAHLEFSKIEARSQRENSNCGWHARRWPSGGSS